MSAFYTGADHVNAILTVLHLSNDFQFEFEGPHGRQASAKDTRELTAVGIALLNENVESLKARYPSYWTEMLGDDAEQYRFKIDASFAARSDRVVAALKLIHSYEYQSCEHDGWQGSWSYRFLQRAKSYLARQLPGYEAAPWSYHRERVTAG